MAISDEKLFEMIYSRHCDKGTDAVIREFDEYKSRLLARELGHDIIDVSPSAPKAIESNTSSSEDKFIPVALTKKDLTRKLNLDAAKTDDAIVCCICGKSFNSLPIHLKRIHKTTPELYNKLCGYPEDTVLMSRNYEEKSKANASKLHTMKKNYDPSKKKAQ